LNEPGGSAEAILAEGITTLGLELDAAALMALTKYVGLLARWNRVYSLTAVRDVAAMVPKHVLDSLAVLPLVRGPRVLDVGTGPGLPGLILAVARPDWSFTLLDASAKKIRFVQQAILELGLSNAAVVRQRVERFAAPQTFDTVIARAFGALDTLLASCDRLVGSHTRVLAMKGKYPLRELHQLPVGYRSCGVTPIDVPGLGAERHVVALQRCP